LAAKGLALRHPWLIYINQPEGVSLIAVVRLFLCARIYPAFSLIGLQGESSPKIMTNDHSVDRENALRIQIWTALIALLVIKWLHYLSKAGWSFSNMAVMLRLNLFTYRDLRGWLDEPYATPPLDSLFNFKVQKNMETRFRTCPIWPPKTLQLLGQVFCFSYNGGADKKEQRLWDPDGNTDNGI